MGKVHLEFSGWTGDTPEVPNSSGKFAIEVEVDDARTVHDMFEKLALNYPHLVGSIYEMKSRVTNERINIFLNGEFILPAEIQNRKLKDGDILTFLPVLAGG